ncbi:glycosyltransferase [Pseudorhodoplanes sp.]|uniref:glycosyltransferase n=1 Tax=Pseudorhodoplanes sp. TaxID=1934341 RepID=UPI003D0EF2AA
MEDHESRSIFERYFSDVEFHDRYQADRAQAVDVLIPIIHTNDLWRANLLSIYREIPVARLLLGDGGCIDDSLEIARAFPRVEVLDHRNFVSLGYSIRHLIEAVQTEWFVYLHSDVFLPAGWFDRMAGRRGEFDWFECNQRITVMADYLFDATKLERAYSGSQMGRRAAFDKVIPRIDDDYLYRNEDIIISELVRDAGFRYGKVGETFHFHQVMHKPSRWRRAIKRVSVDLELGRDEEIRANETYVLGMAKYTDPEHITRDIFLSVRTAIDELVRIEAAPRDELLARVKELSPKWHVMLAATWPLKRDSAAYARVRDATADAVIALANAYRWEGVTGVLRKVLRKLWRSVRTVIAYGIIRLARVLGARQQSEANPGVRRDKRLADRVVALAIFFRDYGLVATAKMAMAKLRPSR